MAHHVPDDPGAQGHTTYYVDVATKHFGEKHHSKATARLKAKTTKISAPINVSVTPVSATELRVNWQPVPAATSYRVRFSTSSNGKNASTHVVAGGGSDSYVIPGLTAHTTYWVDVAAVTAGGSVSPYSAPRAFNTTF